MTPTTLIAEILADANPTAQLWATGVALGLANNDRELVSLPLGMTRQAFHKRVEKARQVLASYTNEHPTDFSHPVFRGVATRATD